MGRLSSPWTVGCVLPSALQLENKYAGMGTPVSTATSSVLGDICKAFRGILADLLLVLYNRVASRTRGRFHFPFSPSCLGLMVGGRHLSESRS